MASFPPGVKLEFMQRILAGHVPSPEEFARMESNTLYRQRICSSYKPLHPQLYKMDPHAFFLPSFLRAIRENTVQDFIHEPTPKVYTFPMLRPAFCEMLMDEVENFQNWARREKQAVNDSNTLEKTGRGTAISDIGMKGMLDDFMKQYISPISKVLFPEVGGGWLDSQHSSVVSYGGDDGSPHPLIISYAGYDNGIDTHVEDSEVTLNVCLGKQFTHGQIHFLGRRCENHVNSGVQLKPLHPQLYKMDPHAFFLPSFLRAIRENTVQDFIHEPTPKVYTFPMLRPAFYEMLMDEVENFQNWARREKQAVNDSNTLEKTGRGTAISDIGMKGMLDDFMKQYISPISKVLFPEVGGGWLDSQHSSVVSYGGDDGSPHPLIISYAGYDNGIDTHVEDSEVTLNVCLGKQFTHGQIHFLGRRCENHVNSGVQLKEGFTYSHVVGQALLYHGRHRHKVCPSIGFRVNMIMLCRSSLFKEMTKCKIDFPDWCCECRRENIRAGTTYRYHEAGSYQSEEIKGRGL